MTVPPIRRIGGKLVDDLVARARQSPRLRMHLNFHGDYAEPVQRFLNAVEPGSYVRPHFHAAGQGPETTYCLTGRGAVVEFSANGAVEEVHPLDPRAGQYGVEIAPGTWHMLVGLEPGTVFLEIKQGPYDPDAAKHFAGWAPEEESPEVADFMLFIESAIRRAHPPDMPEPHRHG